MWMCQGRVWRCLRRRDLDILDRGRDGPALPRVERAGILYVGRRGLLLRMSGQRERGGRGRARGLGRRRKRGRSDAPSWGGGGGAGRLGLGSGFGFGFGSVLGFRIGIG